ncbi:MAG TPA: hypothetical protein VFE58_10245 [Tepidisphaeraceae bacterium]|nr:hypothetical protein [Tepidisphaeraceae bacterium]
MSTSKLPPDVISYPIGITYDASTGSFSATGSLGYGQWSVNGEPGIAYVISDSGIDTFTLNAQIDNTGHLISGTIAITGILTDSSYNELSTDGSVISGTLTNFGFTSTASGNPDLEFTFNANPGGSLNIGPKGGVILTMYDATPNPVSFANDFNDFGGSTADTFAMPVPVPASVWTGTLLLGLLGLKSFSRRTQNASV